MHTWLKAMNCHTCTSHIPFIFWSTSTQVFICPPWEPNLQSNHKPPLPPSFSFSPPSLPPPFTNGISILFSCSKETGLRHQTITCNLAYAHLTSFDLPQWKTFWGKLSLHFPFDLGEASIWTHVMRGSVPLRFCLQKWKVLLPQYSNAAQHVQFVHFRITKDCMYEDTVYQLCTHIPQVWMATADKVATQIKAWLTLWRLVINYKQLPCFLAVWVCHS